MEEKLKNFVHDLEDLITLPCGCQICTRTGETFVFCDYHIAQGQKRLAVTTVIKELFEKGKTQ